MAKPEIYVSIDIEADIKCLPEATPDPDTMAWWAKNPAAWEYVQGRAEGSPTPVSASEAMNNVLSWTEQLPGKPVMFVRWYSVRFCGVDHIRRMDPNDDDPRGHM